jgi:hypothetical protein
VRALVAKLTEAEIQRRLDAVNSHPTIRAAARALGLKPSTLGHCLESLKTTRQVDEGEATPPPPPASPTEIRDANFWRNKAKAAEEQARRKRARPSRDGRHLPPPDQRCPNGHCQMAARGRAVGLIHLSDLHCGEVVRREEAAGFNEYNPEIFQRRLRRMIDASIRILPRWSSDCDLKGVVVALNGDLISGDIHAELRETNALTAHEQVALATDEIAAGLKMLADKFGAVLVTVTPGNHGRTTEKTHAKRMSALSYDIMIGNILAREFAGG